MSRNKNVYTLIHQTDLFCAEKIISSQTMIPGTSGLFGAGIYFANTFEATDLKSHKTGVYLIADVDLGNTKKISKKEATSKTIDTQKLARQGYNSITGHQLPSGREYVAFSSKQVTNIRYAKGYRPKAVFRTSALRIVLFFVTDRNTAKDIVESQQMVKSNGIFGRAYYMYDTIDDALAQRKNGETYLMADVEMENFLSLGNEVISIYKKHQNYKTFRGNYKNSPVYIIKYKNLISKIHYCGGIPWNT